MDLAVLLVILVVGVVVGLGAARMGIDAHHNWIRRMKKEREWLQKILKSAGSFGTKGSIDPSYELYSTQAGKKVRMNKVHLSGMFADLMFLVNNINLAEKYGCGTDCMGYSVIGEYGSFKEGNFTPSGKAQIDNACQGEIALFLRPQHAELVWSLEVPIPEFVSIKISNRREEILTVYVPVKHLFPDFPLPVEIN